MRPYLTCMRYLLPVTAALLAFGSPTFAGDTYPNDPAHHLYDASADAATDIEAALARAALSNKRVLVVFGANWCHDSRGLVEHFQRPEIAEYIQEHFELVYVDVDTPQLDKGRNLELAATYGQSEIVGTPTVVLLDSTGFRINREDTATAWRNSDSRTPEEVMAELKTYAEWQPCYPMPVQAFEGDPVIAPDCSSHKQP